MYKKVVPFFMFMCVVGISSPSKQAEPHERLGGEQNLFVNECKIWAPHFDFDKCSESCTRRYQLACLALEQNAPQRLHQKRYPGYRRFTTTTKLTPVDNRRPFFRALPGARILVVQEVGTKLVGLVTNFAADGSNHQLWSFVTFDKNAVVLTSNEPESNPISNHADIEKTDQRKAAPHGDLLRTPISEEIKAIIGIHEKKAGIAYNYAGSVSPGVGTTGTNFAVQLNCGPVEVLATAGHETSDWTLVRQISNGIEMVGWTQTPITHNWSRNNCFNRVYTSGTSHDKSTPPPEYVNVNEKHSRSQARRLKKVYRVYLLSVKGCTPWHIQNEQLAFSIVYPGGDHGQYVQTYGYGFEISGTGISVTGPWNRATVEGRFVHAGASGCASYYQVVGGTHNQIHLIHSFFGAKSYHPDDVTVFFLNKKACMDVYNQYPRVPLEEQGEPMEPTGIKIFEGC